MTHPKFAVWTTFALGLTLAACSSGGGDSSPITIQSVVQDLDIDPSGTTTVLTLGAAFEGLGAGNIDSDGAQTPLTVTTSGAEVTVVWDSRVTPTHRVRVVNAQGVSPAYADVETSDDSQPTFAITNAQQIAGLGGDQITLQFSGPRVIESEAEDIANWVLEVDDTPLSLTGTTLDYTPATGVLSIVTGAGANLHASFTLAATGVHSVADVDADDSDVNGVAIGDAGAPSLVSAEQNLSEDEFGRVVDFTFDEAMDPVFATVLSNFVAASPDIAVDVEQVDDEVLRVTFNNPIVPGVDGVTLTDLVDAHGNALPNQFTAIAAGSTVANGFTTDPALVTVSNAGGDYLVVEFDQAIDPDDAEDESHWFATYDDGLGAVAIDLSSATLDYDLLTKTLTIQLADDYRNGDTFTFEGDAFDPPMDVDGEPFTTSFSGAVDGDATVPTVLSAVQRRNLDTFGRTIDVTFSEDLDEDSAETVLNWDVAGLNVQTATLVGSRVVRLVVDDTAVPGDATIDVDNVTDLAGNSVVAVVAQGLTSTDLRQPEGVSSLANAIEGVENDTLYVAFNDRLIEGEVEDPANWTFESPIGTPIDVSNAVIDYDDDARAATLTFVLATGVDLQIDDDYYVGWANLRDLAGNVVSTDTLSGDIDAEVVLPSVVSAWVETATPNLLHVRFSEPCQKLDDISGLTTYSVYDNASFLKGAATIVNIDADRMGVELTFSFAVLAASDTLSMRGVLDAAGNPLFSIDGLAVDAEDAGEPALEAGFSTLTVNSGERNDEIELVFDRDLSPWGLLDPSHYDVAFGLAAIDLSNASFAFDGARTVTITLDGADSESLLNGEVYDITVSDLQSAQGVDMSAASMDSIVSGGDAIAPTLPSGWARLDASSSADSVLITFDEALDETTASNFGNYLLNGATAPDSAELLGLRTVRCVFSGGVTLGDTIDFTGVTDLAGNPGTGSRAVSAADLTGPVVVAAAAYSVAGPGADYLTVQFNRPVELSTALSAQNYTLTQGSTTFDLSGAQLWWSSTNFTVTIVLTSGDELAFGSTVTVGADNIEDHAGLAMSPAASINASVQGDSTGPAFHSAFVNWRASSAGAMVDVLFDEAVDADFVTDAMNWTVSGGVTVLGVDLRAPDHVRLELSAALPVGGELELNGLPDLGGNASGVITIEPIQ